MIDAIVERLLSNIMKVETSLEQDFSTVDNQGTDEEQEEGLEQGTGDENEVQPDTDVTSSPIGMEENRTGTGIAPSFMGTGLNSTDKALGSSYIILEGHTGIVFKDRGKLRIKRLGWLYGKRFRNM